MSVVVITGSAGLIGSDSVRFFSGLGMHVVGIDNDMRKFFFGKEASTDWNRRRLEAEVKNYRTVLGRGRLTDQSAACPIY